MRATATTPKVVAVSIFRGFREFVMRGNVVDLAVGVVIGAAFTSVVNQFGDSFLTPLIKLVSGGNALSGTWQVGDVPFDWAAFVNAVIGFLIAAVTVYFLVVLPMNKLRERVARGRSPEPTAPSDEVRLLTEIRDALTGAPASVPGAPGSADSPGRG
jgi:large conductance mechanosensitive channel